MLQEISFYLIFGKPLIMYLGILTLTSFLVTALIAVMNRRGIHVISFGWHPRLAMFSIGCAIVHGILGVLLFY
ncbi:MAG: hypothetical protein ABSG28_01545 [Methanoregula sp.]|uniref:hypothetical protein n=1 Tax=Methanoregula sp. TaxID=2052170 RepID=UPI003C16CF32